MMEEFEDEDGDFSYGCTYEYNEEGDVIAEISVDEYGKEEHSFKNMYEYGLTAEYVFDRHGIVIDKSEIEF